ncbi:MAG TPA: response regulator [Phycisphaerae bacterium]|nr:response regulator [Phycisphaerae bacterium]
MNADGDSRGGAGGRILLIDDDPDMHDAVKMILEPLGHRVTCCSTGPAGLEALRSDPPDLLLLDIMLSSPSEGFYLAAEMKKHPALKDIPIVMISAIGQTMGTAFAKELGSDYVEADLFLEKPLEAGKLREAVGRFLRRGA